MRMSHGGNGFSFMEFSKKYRKYTRSALSPGVKEKGANPKGDKPTYYFENISWKLREN